MITTTTEWQVFKGLVKVLDETIVAIGICEHEVNNICSCFERQLRVEAQKIINKHEERAKALHKIGYVNIIGGK